MSDNELIYQIGLTLIPGIGDVNGKKLVAYCGSPANVFNAKKADLKKVPGIGQHTISSIKSQNILHRAEKEIAFIHKYNIRPLFYTHPDYPKRLLNCDDGPIMLYYKGSASLNNPRIVSIVGTRRATNYGKSRCEELVKNMKELGVLVVSGLAYGIDSCAHRTAVSTGIETVGVVAHGLDTIYPGQNRNLAEKMLQNGGILTEFISGTKPDRENFPKRNRIVAGMSDAIIVIESDIKGGALITAELGNSYNRDVFAVPGRIGDEMSRGTNFFIKTNRAALIESIDDISYIMGWEDNRLKTAVQKKLFVDLSEDEQIIINIITQKEEVAIDQLVIESGLSTSKVAAALLNLEFEGLIKSLPGKIYSI